MSAADQIKQLQDAGFGQDEISAWSAKKRGELASAGYGEGEINDWFGQKEPNTKPIRELVRSNLLSAGASDEAAAIGGAAADFGSSHAADVSQAAVQPGFTPAERAIIDSGANITKVKGAKPARTFEDALSAGMQISVSGLLARGSEPDRVLADDAPMASRIAANIATVAGDLPFMAAGAVLGGGAGVETGPGAVLTAAGGAFALPAGLRATIMDAYRNGDFKNFGDFWERASGIIWEEAKGYMTGVATAGAGLAAKAVLPAGASAAMRTAVPTSAEIATMVTVGRALEGHVPSATDFLDAAVLLGGAKLAVGGAARLERKLQDTYERTGATPRQVMEQAQKDPTVLQDLVAENREAPEVFEAHPGEPDYRPSLSDPDYRQELVLMREETGWAEVGGRMIRAVDTGGEKPEVVGRTPWIARAPWWEGRPQGLTEAKTKAAIDKALAGERLGAAEQRTIDYMLEWARDNVVEPARQLDEGERAAMANELAQASLDQTPRNMREVDLIARAVEYDEAAVDTAAIAHADDHPAFMAEIRRIHDRAEAANPDNARAAAGAGGEGRGKTARQDQEERAALAAEGSSRELEPHELAAAAGGAATAPPMRPPLGARPADSPEPTPSQQAVLDRISVGEGEKRAYTFDKFYTDTKDDLYPIRVITDAIRGDETLTASKDPYKLARETRGLAGKALQFLDYSPFKFDTYENVGKSFKAIVKPLKNDLDGLRTYMVSRRALELDRRGIESGVPLDEARDVVRGGGKYETASRELLEYQDHLVRYLVDAGVVSRDGAAAMREANRDYVPFFRLMDEPAAKGGAGPGFSVRSPIKSIKGSERRIIDPLESIVKNTYLYTTLAERNAVSTALVNLSEAAGGRDDLVKKVATPAKPVEVQAKEIQAFLEAHGIDAESEAFTIFRRGYVNPAENEIVNYRDGKRDVYEVPREVAATFKALDRESANLIVKMLAIPAKLLRAGATLSPDFTLRNLTRDQTSAAVFSDNGYVPVLDFIRGLTSIAKKDNEFQAWLKSGGANATMISMDRQYLQAKIEEIAETQSVAKKAWNVVKTPVELLRITSELIENSTRLGEFKRGVGGDLSKESAQEAAFESREVTLDFARIGAKTRSINMITAFWNAQVEGVDRAARAFIDHPLRTSARVAAYITAPSVLLWFANHEDPRWKEIPNWERDLFWIVMTKDHIYRIPKPFELGVVFGSLPERLLDKFYDEKPEAMRDLMKSVWNAFVPGVIPTLHAPILEQMTNHSFFADRPLVPDSLEKILPEYQYTPYTSEVTKALGHIIGSVPGFHEKSIASPLVIDNYVRGWTGTLGVYAIQIADAALRKTGVLPDPVKPAATLADMPVIKAFVVRYPSAQAQSIVDFNDHYKESKIVIDTVGYLAKQGDVDAALREARMDPVKIVRLDGIHEAIANAHRVIQLIDKNPNFAADEKRQLIDNTYTQMIDMAREGEQMLREVKKELGPRFHAAPEAAAQSAPAVH